MHGKKRMRKLITADVYWNTVYAYDALTYLKLTGAQARPGSVEQ